MMKNFWKNKKVLVTGGAGFIGSHVVEELVKLGAQTKVAISPRTSTERINRSLGHIKNKIKIGTYDLLHIDDCLEAAKEQEVIFNFAAIDGGAAFKSKYPAKIFRANSQIALNMLESASINKVKRFLLVSSIEVYAEKNNKKLEEHLKFSLDLQKPVNGYVWSKRLSEIAAKMYAHEHGLNIAIARLGNIYGPGDYEGIEKTRVIPTFIHRIINNEDITLWGKGNQKKSFLHVKDATRALLQLTEKYPVCEPVNIASERYLRIKDLANMLMKLHNSSTKLILENKSGARTKNHIISVEKAKAYAILQENIALEAGLMETINYYKRIS